MGAGLLSNESLEEMVLALLCFSNEQAPILLLKITDNEIFNNPTNKTIAKAAIDFVTKYSVAPGIQLDYILDNDIKRGETGRLIRLEIDNLQKRVSELDSTYVHEHLDHFIETQKLTNALQDSLLLLGEGELQQAKEKMYKAAVVPVNNSPGIWLKKPAEALRFLDADEATEFFSSGIALLDSRGVRPERKTISFMIAASGKGKSWWLIEIGKSGLQHHKKVLHITLELSEEKTAKRYIQSIFSLTKDDLQHIKAPYFHKDVNGNTSFDFHEFNRESVFTKREEIYNKLLDMTSYPDLLIKEFPTASLSVEQLSLYLDTLEQQKQFKPDLLIIDYADLMKIDAATLRIDTGRLYRELRGLAVSRNIALVSATQGNRDSDTAKLVGSTNVAEDWSKIGTADCVLTYSQTPEEHKLGLARVFVAKNRDSSDKFIALISQSYNIGQFCLDSTSMSPELVTQIQNTPIQ